MQRVQHDEKLQNIWFFFHCKEYDFFSREWVNCDVIVHMVKFNWTTFFNKELIFSAHLRNNVCAFSFSMQLCDFMDNQNL